MFLSRLRDSLLEAGYKLYPASKEHMTKLQQIYGELPLAYVEFLNLMGAGTNSVYFQGESCFTDELFHLNEWGRELLLENDSIHTLEDSDFVFFMSQGCMFCYFNLAEGNDPPVYFYTENRPNSVKKIADKFSDFLWNFYRHPTLALQGEKKDD